MSYQIYITDALVCGSKDNNTSDKSYLLFTREGGMMWVSAKSAREERSKHRYALQEFSVIRASLVRGKSGWRVTGAEPRENLYYLGASREARTLVRNIVRLIRRLIHGETPAPVVFDDVVRMHIQEPYNRESLEKVLTLRILAELGYVAPMESYQSLLEAKNLSDAYMCITPKNLEASSKAISHALDISHL